jgi:hypothetical protein
LAVTYLAIGKRDGLGSDMAIQEHEAIAEGGQSLAAAHVVA